MIDSDCAQYCSLDADRPFPRGDVQQPFMEAVLRLLPSIVQGVSACEPASFPGASREQVIPPSHGRFARPFGKALPWRARITQPQPAVTCDALCRADAYSVTSRGCIFDDESFCTVSSAAVHCPVSAEPLRRLLARRRQLPGALDAAASDGAACRRALAAQRALRCCLHNAAPKALQHRPRSCSAETRLAHAPLTPSQVTNQLKILPTAGFSALFLGRQLSSRQWVALPLLALGVAAVNASSASGAQRAAAVMPCCGVSPFAPCACAQQREQACAQFLLGLLTAMCLIPRHLPV